MKQILTLGVALLITITISAQKNITKFMGIPIDGTKSEMIQKLKAKGFSWNGQHEFLEGEFNGREVHIYIGTNNNKVYRIMVADAQDVGESEIKIRFNKLCQQFQNNGKYLPTDLLGSFELGSDEDISYEMSVHKKRYQASYYQFSEEDKDTTGLAMWATEQLLSRYTEEEREKMSEEDGQKVLFELMMDYILDKVSDKSVWFMINEIYGRYYISIYYDNKKNQANGEDL